MRERIFVGLKPNVNAVEAMRSFRVRAGQALGAVKALKWVPEPNWHLTLWFVGEVEIEQRMKLEAALEKLTPPVGCQNLDKWIAFPAWDGANVIGLGGNSVATGLAKCVQQLHDLGRELEIKPQDEERPFVPHVALARLHKRTRMPPRLSSFETIPFQFNGFSLFQSVPSNSGVLYPILKQYRLASSP